MRVVKRNGEFQRFDRHRIEKAILAAFHSVQPDAVPNINGLVAEVAEPVQDGTTVEEIQDWIEKALMERYPDVAKAFILYREERAQVRGKRLHPDPRAISEYIHHAKYAFQGAETYEETALRTRDMHIRRYPRMEQEICEVWAEFVLPQLVLPSMRSMQFGGPAIEYHHAKMYNCSFTLIDRVEAFYDTLFLLLCGCGVGYSVQYCHVHRLPKVRRVGRKVRHFSIPDTIEGWRLALKELMESHFIHGEYVEFDYSGIRPEGAPLQRSGGIAPGHLELKHSLETIREKLNQVRDRQLRPIECHDIICHEADCVLAGGVRRSSLIALFSPDDGEMMSCKTGDWMTHTPWRRNANNSAVLVRDWCRREQFHRVLMSAKEYGDPGFFFTDNRDYGCNPCGEIGLYPVIDGQTGFAFCNLTEINGAKEFGPRVARAAAFIGTLQAGYTDFWCPVTTAIAKRDALLGVSITGMMDQPDRCLDPATQREAADAAVAENRRVAQMIGIRPARSVTTVKPSGTASLELGGVANGIHPHHARRYLRRVIANPNEIAFKVFHERNPHMVTRKPDGDYVITFPIEVGEDAITKRNCEMPWFMEQVFSTYENWISPGSTGCGPTHNVSCTVLVDDWEVVEQIIWINRHRVQAISVFPDFGEIVHPFAPMQESTDEALWNHLIEHYRPVDRWKAGTTITGSACEGATCEV